MPSLSDVIAFFKENYSYGFGCLAILIVFWLFRIILDEDKSAAFRAAIFKSLYKATKKQKYAKAFISNDINAKVNAARKKLYFGTEVLPRSMRVEWLKDDVIDGYTLKEGEFIVCLDPAESQMLNILRLVEIVVKRTTLLGVRSLIDTNIRQSVDLNMARKIIKQIDDKEIMDHFFENIYKKYCEENVELSRWNVILNEIDDRGLFTRVLLVELERYAKNIYGKQPRPYMAGTIESLVHFIYKIAIKDVAQDVPLDYERAHINFGIILVAKTDKILSQGIEPYVKAFAAKLNQKSESVYVVIYDKEFLGEYSPDLSEQFEKDVEDLDAEIQSYVSVRKVMSDKYIGKDVYGKMRKVRIFKYNIEDQGKNHQEIGYNEA